MLHKCLRDVELERQRQKHDLDNCHLKQEARTEQAGVAAMLYSNCILEAPGWDPGRFTSYPD
jgi:hypothetical protein